MDVTYFELLKLVAPETALVLTVLAVLGVDLVVMREESVPNRFQVVGGFACVGCGIAMLLLLTGHGVDHVLNGMLAVDPLTRLVKLALVGLSVFTILISLGSRFTEHVGEYLSLILLATIGMMFMVSSEELLMVFVSLELTSLSLYILTAFNKQNLRSAEAALKYFLFGGVAAAFTLFGLSLIYGLTGSTNLRLVAEALRGQGMDPLLAVAMVMTVIGFGFKVAAVPFHLWAPDAYQGAPTPSAALIASGSKVASFFIFAKVMILGFAGVEGSGAWHRLVSGWVPLLAAVAAFSLVMGNLIAIAQSSVKRLLAYSAIAHAGYMLLGLLSHDAHGVAALVYYSITYGLATIGAFAVVHVVEESSGSEEMDSFAGLSRRAPLLALSMMVFILSLAGIPPLAGFFGKFYLFVAAAQGARDLGLLWLVILAIGMSAVSLYYYLQVLKRIYVADGPADAVPMKTGFTTGIIMLLAALVIAFGCVPDAIIAELHHAIGNAGF
jgi:NADH-quinone oxidoreductase subunit N